MPLTPYFFLYSYSNNTTFLDNKILHYYIFSISNFVLEKNGWLLFSWGHSFLVSTQILFISQFYSFFYNIINIHLLNKKVEIDFLLTHKSKLFIIACTIQLLFFWFFSSAGSTIFFSLQNNILSIVVSYVFSSLLYYYYIQELKFYYKYNINWIVFDDFRFYGIFVIMISTFTIINFLIFLIIDATNLEYFELIFKAFILTFCATFLFFSTIKLS